MTLSPCYRATCDAPRCRAAFMSPHGRTNAVRSQLRACGWSFLRWYPPPRPGKRRLLMHDTLEYASVKTRDVGGGVRTLYRCPAHGSWTPRLGRSEPGARVAPQDGGR